VFKNTASQSVTVLAIDTSTNLPKGGDAANITLYYNGDGGGVTVFSTGSGHPAEDDATNAPGCYSLAMTQAETNYSRLNITGKSSTSGVRIIPILNLQTVPSALGNAAGATNGLLIAGSNAATTFVGASASGGTPATAGLTITGGTASTTSGGTAAPGMVVTGGDGAALVNGAAAGATYVGGGTTTVSGGDGMTVTGTNNGAGMTMMGGSNGPGWNATGSGSNPGLKLTGGAAGAAGLKASGSGGFPGIHGVGGASGGDGIAGTCLAGGRNGLRLVGDGSNPGFYATGGSTGDGGQFVGNGGGVDLRAGITGNITGNLSGSAGSVTTVSDKTGYGLAAAGLDSVVVEIGLNARQALALKAAALAGVLSGAATSTVTIKGAGVATTRIVATVDASGNRSALTLTPPA
jgi:hypothetical protein